MRIEPGDLAVIRYAGDQTPWVRRLVGSYCVVVRNLTPAEGVTSSRNIWEVLVDGRVISVHALDLEILR